MNTTANKWALAIAVVLAGFAFISTPEFLSSEYVSPQAAFVIKTVVGVVSAMVAAYNGVQIANKNKATK